MSHNSDQFKTYSVEQFQSFISDNHIQGVINSLLRMKEFGVDHMEPVLVIKYRPDKIGEFLIQSNYKKGWTTINSVTFKTSKESPQYVANQTSSVNERKDPKVLVKGI